MNKILLIICLYSFVLGGCVKASNYTTNQINTYNGYQNTLPKDWPIPQLTFPGTITINSTGSRGINMPSPDGGPAKLWMVFIHCEDGMEGVVDHVSSSLGPAGYTEVKYEFQNNNPMDFMRIYFSSNGLIEITIVEDVTRGGKASKSEMQQVIGNRRYNTDGSPSNIKDFILSVTVHKSQTKEYQMISNSQDKIHLVPLQ